MRTWLGIRYLIANYIVLRIGTLMNSDVLSIATFLVTHKVKGIFNTGYANSFAWRLQKLYRRLGDRMARGIGHLQNRPYRWQPRLLDSCHTNLCVSVSSNNSPYTPAIWIKLRCNRCYLKCRIISPMSITMSRNFLAHSSLFIDTTSAILSKGVNMKFSLRIFYFSFSIWIGLR